jgi:hypothetical protein
VSTRPIHPPGLLRRVRTRVSGSGSLLVVRRPQLTDEEITALELGKPTQHKTTVPGPRPPSEYRISLPNGMTAEIYRNLFSTARPWSYRVLECLQSDMPAKFEDEHEALKGLQEWLRKNRDPKR